MKWNHVSSYSSQLTLQAQGDPAIRAAWEVYVQSRDIEDLVDTMLRIIQRESSSISVEEETSQLRQRAIRTLVRLKKLSGPVGDALIGVLASRDDKVKP